MAAITPTRGPNVPGAHLSVADFWQHVANSYAALSWAAGTTWDATADALVVTGATAYGFFVNAEGTDLREERKAELRQISRPSGKRFMTAALTTPGSVFTLTLSDTHAGRVATGAATDVAHDTFGVLGTSF